MKKMIDIKKIKIKKIDIKWILWGMSILFPFLVWINAIYTSISTSIFLIVGLGVGILFYNLMNGKQKYLGHILILGICLLLMIVINFDFIDGCKALVNRIYECYATSSNYIFDYMEYGNELMQEYEYNKRVIFLMFMLIFHIYLWIQYYMIVKWKKYFLGMLISMVLYIPLLLYSTKQPWLYCILLYGYWVSSILLARNRKKQSRNASRMMICSFVSIGIIVCSTLVIIPEKEYTFSLAASETRGNFLKKMEEIANFFTRRREKDGEVDLNQAGDRIYTGREELAVYTDFNRNVYLKGFTGAIYDEGVWRTLDEDIYKQTNNVDWEKLRFWTNDKYDLTNHDIKTIKVLDKRLRKRYGLLPYYLSDVDGKFSIYYDAYAKYISSNPVTFKVWDRNHKVDYPKYNVRNMDEKGKYRKFVYDNYLQVPPDMEAFFDTWFSEYFTKNLYLDEGFEADLDSVTETVVRFLSEGYTYTTTPGKTPKNKDVVKYFLSESMQGYCVHYASAATLLLRYSGIPARYVEGYRMTTKHKRNAGYYGVLDNDAHAWVEVFMADIGWVPIEVTFSDQPTQYHYEEVDPDQLELGGEGFAPGTLIPNANPELVAPSAPLEDMQELISEEENGFNMMDLPLEWIALGFVIAGIIGQPFIRRGYRLLKIKKSKNKNKILYYYRYYEKLKLYDAILPQECMNLVQKARFSQHDISDDEVVYMKEHIRKLRKETLSKMKWYKRIKVWWMKAI